MGNVSIKQQEKIILNSIEGITFPCGQCDYQATTKGNLEQHRRSVHERRDEIFLWVMRA